MPKYIFNHVLFCPFKREKLNEGDAILHYMKKAEGSIYYDGDQHASYSLLDKRNTCLGIIGHGGGTAEMFANKGGLRLSVAAVIRRVQETFSKRALHILNHVDIVSCFGAGKQGQEYETSFLHIFKEEWESANLPPVDMSGFKELVAYGDDNAVKAGKHPKSDAQNFVHRTAAFPGCVRDHSGEHEATRVEPTLGEDYSFLDEDESAGGTKKGFWAIGFSPLVYVFTNPVVAAAAVSIIGVVGVGVTIHYFSRNERERRETLRVLRESLEHARGQLVATTLDGDDEKHQAITRRIILINRTIAETKAA